MQDLIISLNGNVLKVSVLVGGEFSTYTKDLPSDVLNDSRIVDTHQLAFAIKDALRALNMPAKKCRMTFVMEPEDVIFRFLTVSKTAAEDLEAKILEDAQNKLEGISLSDLYFSYVKIAPFVYQFVGVNKNYLEKYLEVSDIAQIPLYSVVPWVMLLPKYVGSNQSAIFVCGINANPIVVLSELNGVFFVGSYSENESPEELYKLVQELSVYKRSKPIDKVYTFNYPHLASVEGLSVHKVEVPNAGSAQTVGFEANLLANYMLDLEPDTVSTQANLLNLLPLPVVEKKPMSLALVAAPISALLLVGIIFGGITFLNKNKNASINKNNGQVLSEQVTTVETKQSSPTPTPNLEPSPKALDRKDLVVRVENGSGATGVAAKTKEFLENLGYKVISIDTANSQRDTSLFKFKSNKLDYKKMVIDDLKDKLPSTVVEDGIDTSNEYDLLIVVGTTEKF